MPGIYRIHEDVVSDKRLGRHVRHDPRSLAYQVEPRGSVVSARWNRVTPILDQGDLGSCTGNATVGVLGTEPYFTGLRAAFPNLVLNEAYAVQVYSAATLLDGDPDHYPPTDTGSDGLSVAKVVQKAGFISGYRHITSIDGAHTAIQTGPFITGTNWLSGMDNPDSNGIVTATGSVRGGHEYEVIGYDAQRDLWEFVNSWGTSWGKGGHFFLSSADYAKLLADDGDATQFVPISQPAPSPSPVSPTPTVPAFPVDAIAPWLNSRLYTTKGVAAQKAIKAWLAAGGK
jgi:hypothetical protein